MLNQIESVPLAGLIFHTSRCGSTLFAKALGTSEANLVSVQPGPLQPGFWSALTDGFRRDLQASDENVASFRALVSLLVRRQSERHERAFLKFISWNVLYIDFIMRALPNVPIIFLYRDPVEIIASVRRSKTAILEAKDYPQAEFLTRLPRQAIDAMDDTEYLAVCYREWFRVVVDFPGDQVSLLEYPELTAARFPDIIQRVFDLEPSPGEIEVMMRQFNVHSKDDSGKAKFESDRVKKQRNIDSYDRMKIDMITSKDLQRLRTDSRNLY